MQSMWAGPISPSRDDLWRRAAAQLGATFRFVGFWGLPEVQLQHRQWTIVLDIWKRGSIHVIRMRTRILNRDGFWFSIYPQGVVSTARKWLGLQDVAVGHERFDGEFIIQGNDEAKLKVLFDNPRIRFLLESQPSVHFSIADREHSLWGVPEGIDELCLTSGEEILEVAGLHRLFELFMETLDELCRLETIAIDDPLVRF
jgi:hypothetical protein